MEKTKETKLVVLDSDVDIEEVKKNLEESWKKERLEELNVLISEIETGKIKKRENLEDALRDLQWRLKDLKKDSAAFKYNYLSLPEFLNRIYAVSGVYGLLFSFEMGLVAGDMYSMTVTVKHCKTGEIKSSTVYSAISREDVQPGQNLQQLFGSAQTYMRRYALQNLLGVAADDDDDAGGNIKKFNSRD